LSLQTTTEQLSLTDDIKLAVPTDGFLSGVLESVKYSDNNFFQNFFIDSTSISHISRQASLEPFVTGMSVVRVTVRISVVNDFEVHLTTLYDCVDTRMNHIGSQGNTDTDTDIDTDTDTDTHRHTV